MRYVAPAKLNLNLLVSPRDETGLHPIRSVVQTIEFCDVVRLEEADESSFEVSGIEVPTDDDNLVMRALEAAKGEADVPPLTVKLEKRIPVSAGLGGGSADAAATLAAVAEMTGMDSAVLRDVARRIGADVTFPLTGGTAEMGGYGERIDPMPPLQGVAVAVIVPGVFLSTPEVYRRWDELGEPEGFEVPDRLLPPLLRHTFPIRNDLYRAAVDLEPELGDFVSDVSARWDEVVMMTGSGSACFGFFPTSEEAAEAAAAIPGTRSAFGAALRPRGVERVE
jgi:4-diphosphocytidyl-2-C-methyl-D-erythritol kinase